MSNLKVEMNNEATRNAIQIRLAAYSSLPIVSGLVLTYSTQNMPVCESDNKSLEDASLICHISSSLLCLCMTVVIIFQVSELLSKKGAEVALLRLKQSGFTRSSCLLFFALSLISCLIGNTSNVVRTISAIGIAITLGALTIYFIIERSEF